MDAAARTQGPTPAEPAAARRFEDGGRDPMAEWPTGRLLSTASRLVEHAWLRALERLGVTHAGLIVLHLLEAGPASQKELARRARVQNQTMSRTLDRLERDGHVLRVADPHDRRRHVVTRTDAGTLVWKTADRLEADVFPDVADQGALRALLLDIIRSGESARWAGEGAEQEPVGD